MDTAGYAKSLLEMTKWDYDAAVDLLVKQSMDRVVEHKQTVRNVMRMIADVAPDLRNLHDAHRVHIALEESRSLVKGTTPEEFRKQFKDLLT